MIVSNVAETNKEKIIEPYVGPTHFTRTPYDQMRFFGRDNETDEIVSLILSHRVILIYSQSGAGKTSIFEAKVAPTLENYGFDVLPRARVGIASSNKFTLNLTSTNDASSQEVNFYMLNTFQSLKPEIDPRSFYNKSLFEFLKEYFWTDGNTNSKPQVLMLDQFEELFTYYPGNTWRKQQEKFFKQIAEALAKYTDLRIVFVIREDHLAELDRFADILPERLRPRFRLERLNKRAAFSAIKEPLKKLDSSFYNDTNEELDKRINEIVISLSKIRVEDPLQDKNTDEPTWVEGEFVEPIQLQVVCQRRWKQLFSPGNTNSSQTELRNLMNVDIVLKEFYEEAIRKVVEETGVSENAIRKMFQDKLITSSGTRAFIHQRDFIQALITSSGTRAFVHLPSFIQKWIKSIDSKGKMKNG